MAHPAYIREKARQLRREKKLTIDELSECLTLPRTTIYYWVRDMPIGQTPRRTAAQLRAAWANKQRHRLIREASYNYGFVSFVTLIDKPGFRDFVCVYIGEGYKRNRNVVQISNSDPAV